MSRKHSRMQQCTSTLILRCSVATAASALSQAGYAEEDIRKFIGWCGKVSLRYERDFDRPSTLGLAQAGRAMSLRDIHALVPPQRFQRQPTIPTPTFNLRTSTSPIHTHQTNPRSIEQRSPDIEHQPKRTKRVFDHLKSKTSSSGRRTKTNRDFL